MNRTDQRYKGFKLFKMDPKFRVSIQPLWRPKAGSPLFLLFSKSHEMPMVKVLSQEAYNEKVELIQASAMTPKQKSQMLGKLAMLSREASLNEQGKLLVPKDLSEQAGIVAEAEVYLVGRGIHFEIWSKANFETVLNIESGQQDDDDELGIF
ncbi:MAG: division/cell wall cluster transcriptional repressor MraZ [Verrucomicrobia bacterium]|nr:division/cell wall cluster transcriptional repressor MraZ [Verrucomicrobiota bacterium]